MSLRFHEIAEANHRILNPFTEAQLDLLGRLCRLQPGMTQLDLCCGKGEMLCRWAREHGIRGVGVDISRVFLPAAQARAAELGVADRVHFVHGDARQHEVLPSSYHVVSCIGATWIGDGLVGAIAKLKPGLRDKDSLMLIGEPYWIDPPPPEAVQVVIEDGDEHAFASLAGTQQRLETHGMELIEMVLADGASWDRYVAAQWRTMSDWLRANPHDAEFEVMRLLHENSRRDYLAYQRRYLGWGVFVLRQR